MPRDGRHPHDGAHLHLRHGPQTQRTVLAAASLQPFGTASARTANAQRIASQPSAR
jgi:hypothetical protein